MHVVEEWLRVHLVDLHHAGERGAELPVVALLQMPRVGVRHAQEAGDELAHAMIDLGEQVALGGIERVVEVEDPDVGGIEAARDLGSMPLPRL